MAENSLKKGRYTKYSNKIGLYSNTKGNFIKADTEVVLNFPFKDAVLEAGMSKEDNGREERFLQVDVDGKDIDTLEEPKVLTDFRLVDESGETSLTASSDIEFFDENGDLTQNLLIQGNNLLALHTLKGRLSDRVKLIYIDPPYNTGNDGFRYNDSFNHSAWLAFMKNRLEIARELLSEAGILMISIGEQEYAYLKVLTDEIFGRGNVLSNIVWHNNKKGRQMDAHIKNSYENILVIAKNLDEVQFNNKVTEVDTTGYEFDEISPYKKDYPLHNGTADFHINNRPNLAYSIYYNPSTAEAVTIDEKVGERGSFVIGEPSEQGEQLLSDGYVRILPKYNHNYNNQRVWRWGSEKFGKEYKTELLFVEEAEGYYIYQKKRFADGLHSQKYTNYIDIDGGNGKKELQTLFSNKVFDNPKPERLLAYLLDMTTVEGDLVLDFCLGSGTTSAVAHKMKRRWVGIEQMDYIEEVAKERLKKVVAGEQGGVSKDTGWSGGGSFVYFELKKYNQEYIDRIMEATSLSELEEIYVEMRNNAFLKFWFDRNSFEKDEDFRQLDLDGRKQKLADVLDENQLYLNYADMNDTRHNVTTDEEVLTDRFYGSSEN